MAGSMAAAESTVNIVKSSSANGVISPAGAGVGSAAAQSGWREKEMAAIK